MKTMNKSILGILKTMANTSDVKKTGVAWVESKKEMVSILNMQLRKQKMSAYSINVHVNDFRRKRIFHQFSIEICGLFFLLIFSIGLVIGLLPSTHIGNEEKSITKVTLKPPGNFLISNLWPIQNIYTESSEVSFQ